MKKILLAACAVVAVSTAAPSGAVLVDTIRISSRGGTYLQIAEVEVFSGATNVALASNGAVASAFSSLFGFTGPDKTIDGFTDGQPYGHGIYISSGTGANEFLQINLAHSFNVSTLKIYGREDCCQDRDTYTFRMFNAGVAGPVGALSATGQDAGNVGVAAVPEPLTWTLMIAGFGAVGTALRRRSPTGTVARAA